MSKSFIASSSIFCWVGIILHLLSCLINGCIGKIKRNYKLTSGTIPKLRRRTKRRYCNNIRQVSVRDILWPCVQEQPSILSQKLHLWYNHCCYNNKRRSGGRRSIVVCPPTLVWHMILQGDPDQSRLQTSYWGRNGLDSDDNMDNYAR